MTVFEIDGARIRTWEDFNEEFERLPFVPGFYGRNLNALWDVLTGFLTEPTRIVWKDAEASRAALGSGFGQIVAIMREAEAETAGYSERFELELAAAAGQLESGSLVRSKRFSGES